MRFTLPRGLLALLSLLVLANARSVFVNFLTGNDAGAGTTTDPFLTLGQCITSLQGSTDARNAIVLMNDNLDGASLPILTGNCFLRVENIPNLVIRSFSPLNRRTLHCPPTGANEEFTLEFATPRIDIRLMNFNGYNKAIKGDPGVVTLTVKDVDFTNGKQAVATPTGTVVWIQNVVISNIDDSATYNKVISLVVDAGARVTLSNVQVDGGTQNVGRVPFTIFGTQGSPGVMRISGSTFTNFAGSARLFEVRDMDTVIQNSIFDASTVEDVALHFRRGNALTIYSSTFDNIATSSGNQGGAIRTDGVKRVSVQPGTSFSNINARSGGAMYTNDAEEVVISGSSFTSCSVTNVGGAVAISRSAAPSVFVNIQGSTFTDCSASVVGGAIFATKGFTTANPASMVILGNTFENNNGGNHGGAIFAIGVGPAAVIQNNNFNYNLATQGFAVRLGNQNQAEISNNNICVADASTCPNAIVGVHTEDDGPNTCGTCA